MRRPTPQALAALERLGTDPKHELTIADLLEPLYRQVGDWQKLVGVHEVQVRRSDDVSRRVELLHQIAQLYEDSAGDLASAFATLARALKEDPANESTQQQLDRVARATGRFADLAQAFEQLAGQIEDPALASALYMTSARVQESDLGNVDNAIALYRKVLEIDPLSLAAAESLERLFRTTERYQDLSLILQRKSEILEEPLEKKDALFQAAAIEEDVLERPEAAIAVYNKVLEIDGDDLRAIDALIRRYLDLSRWQDLLARLREEGRPRRRRRRRRRPSTTRSAPSTSASSATCPAPSTRTPRSSSSIRTISRPSRASTSSTSRRRTGASCSRC